MWHKLMEGCKVLFKNDEETRLVVAGCRHTICPGSNKCVQRRDVMVFVIFIELVQLHDVILGLDIHTTYM